MTRSIRSPEDLQQATNHLFYEVWMFETLAQTMALGIAGRGDDFFTGPSHWQKIRPPKTERLAKAKKRADKEVAHLTYTRLDITPEEKHWDFVKKFDGLQVLIQLFLSSIPVELLGSKWESTKQGRTGLQD